MSGQGRVVVEVGLGRVGRLLLVRLRSGLVRLVGLLLLVGKRLRRRKSVVGEGERGRQGHDEGDGEHEHDGAGAPNWRFSFRQSGGGAAATSGSAAGFLSEEEMFFQLSARDRAPARLCRGPKSVIAEGSVQLFTGPYDLILLPC